jgi:hypothetical protein
LATAKRYSKAKAPVDDSEAMLAWIEKQRSRRGVGKYTPRTDTPAQIALAREVVAEIVPVEPAEVTTPIAAADDSSGSTLQRLERAERVAYQRYIDSGGSERAAQIWLLVCDQKRKLVADLQKQASDVSEAETRFMGLCAEVILEFKKHLESAPETLGILCEGLSRDEIEKKIDWQIKRILHHVSSDLLSLLKGTSLEVWLQPS